MNTDVNTWNSTMLSYDALEVVHELASKQLRPEELAWTNRG